jgi:type VI protein secretion system component VasK
MDRDAETGLQRLMSVQDRAQSIATLRQAPTVVVQIVEDALAQTAAAHADMLTNPLTRAWQVEVLPACRAVEGRFPFGDGADADPRAVARLLAPGGAMDRFFRARAEPYLDMAGPDWRWKTEARFSGLAPDSAEFLRRGQALSAGLFRADGALAADLSMAALAEKGKAFVTLGGQGGPVETTADPLTLAWPGARPEDGIEVSFQTPQASATLKEAGAWGLLRLLMPLRLRERDDGQRFLVDLRAGAARLFVEITFTSPANPLSRRAILKGFACPQVL